MFVLSRLPSVGSAGRSFFIQSEVSGPESSLLQTPVLFQSIQVKQVNSNVAD